MRAEYVEYVHVGQATRYSKEDLEEMIGPVKVVGNRLFVGRESLQNIEPKLREYYFICPRCDRFHPSAKCPQVLEVIGTKSEAKPPQESGT